MSPHSPLEVLCLVIVCAFVVAVTGAWLSGAFQTITIDEIARRVQEEKMEETPMSEPKLQFYQGDVGIVRVDKMTKNVKEVPRDGGRVILAYGEVTGHAHALNGNKVALFRDDGIGRTFLKVEEPDTLVHEEHSPITLPAGIYEIIQQREWDGANERAFDVVD